MTTATNWSNITSLDVMLKAANTNSPFWLGMIFMIFAVFLISFSSYGGFVFALLASSFVAFVIGLFLAYMGLVAWTWVLMFFGFTIVGILWATFSKR